MHIHIILFIISKFDRTEHIQNSIRNNSTEKIQKFLLIRIGRYTKYRFLDQQLKTNKHGRNTLLPPNLSELDQRST